MCPVRTRPSGRLFDVIYHRLSGGGFTSRGCAGKKEGRVGGRPDGGPDSVDKCNLVVANSKYYDILLIKISGKFWKYIKKL